MSVVPRSTTTTSESPRYETTSSGGGAASTSTNASLLQSLNKEVALRLKELLLLSSSLVFYFLTLVVHKESTAQQQKPNPSVLEPKAGAEERISKLLKAGEARDVHHDYKPSEPQAVVTAQAQPRRLISLANWSILQSVLTRWRVLHEIGQPGNLRKEEQLFTKVERGRKVKKIAFIRHGQSTANAAYDIYKRDTFIFDAELTPKGVSQVQDLKQNLSGLPFELIVVSPLRRAIQTTLIAFEEEIKRGVPVIVHPLAREQMTASDDVGTYRHDLESLYPHLSFDMLPERDFWWYNDQPELRESMGDFCNRYIAQNGMMEPPNVAMARIKGFEKWLAERTEKMIAVVSHGTIIRKITGTDLRNAQLVSLEVDPDSPPNSAP